jgi:hypothetical protein
LSFRKEKLNFRSPRLTKKRGHPTGERWTKVRLFTNKKSNKIAKRMELVGIERTISLSGCRTPSSPSRAST